MTERQEADGRREPNPSSPCRHRARNRRPRGQIAVVDEVVLGEPEIEAEPVEPRHLLDDLRVEIGRGDSGVRWIPEVVDDTQPERGTRHEGGWCGKISIGSRRRE
jgi:hypothetical protein